MRGLFVCGLLRQDQYRLLLAFNYAYKARHVSLRLRLDCASSHKLAFAGYKVVFIETKLMRIFFRSLAAEWPPSKLSGHRSGRAPEPFRNRIEGDALVFEVCLYGLTYFFTYTLFHTF